MLSDIRIKNHCTELTGYWLYFGNMKATKIWCKSRKCIKTAWIENGSGNCSGQNM